MGTVFFSASVPVGRSFLVWTTYSLLSGKIRLCQMKEKAAGLDDFVICFEL